MVWGEVDVGAVMAGKDDCDDAASEATPREPHQWFPYGTGRQDTRKCLQCGARVCGEQERAEADEEDCIYG